MIKWPQIRPLHFENISPCAGISRRVTLKFQNFARYIRFHPFVLLVSGIGQKLGPTALPRFHQKICQKKLVLLYDIQMPKRTNKYLSRDSICCLFLPYSRKIVSPVSFSTFHNSSLTWCDTRPTAIDASSRILLLLSTPLSPIIIFLDPATSNFLIDDDKKITSFLNLTFSSISSPYVKILYIIFHDSSFFREQFSESTSSRHHWHEPMRKTRYCWQQALSVNKVSTCIEFCVSHVKLAREIYLVSNP